MENDVWWEYAPSDRNSPTPLLTSEWRRQRQTTQRNSNDDAVGPVSPGAFFLVLSPVVDSLSYGALETLEWFTEILIMSQLKATYNDATKVVYHNMTALQVSGVHYYRRQRRQLEDDSSHDSSQANGQANGQANTYANASRELFAPMAEVRFSAPDVYFESPWSPSVALPTPQELRAIVEECVTSQMYIGSLKLSVNGQLQKVTQVDFGSTPTSYPTILPTANPTYGPTFLPTSSPTAEPTLTPTSNPTSDPTYRPTSDPTYRPTVRPTDKPTWKPTRAHTGPPTSSPSRNPASKGSFTPSFYFTTSPSILPSTRPTAMPLKHSHSFPPTTLWQGFGPFLQSSPPVPVPLRMEEDSIQNGSPPYRPHDDVLSMESSEIVHNGMDTNTAYESTNTNTNTNSYNGGSDGSISISTESSPEPEKAERPNDETPPNDERPNVIFPPTSTSTSTSTWMPTVAEDNNSSNVDVNLIQSGQNDNSKKVIASAAVGVCIALVTSILLVRRRMNKRCQIDKEYLGYHNDHDSELSSSDDSNQNKGLQLWTQDSLSPRHGPPNRRSSSMSPTAARVRAYERNDGRGRGRNNNNSTNDPPPPPKTTTRDEHEPFQNQRFVMKNDAPQIGMILYGAAAGTGTGTGTHGGELYDYTRPHPPSRRKHPSTSTSTSTTSLPVLSDPDGVSRLCIDTSGRHSTSNSSDFVNLEFAPDEHWDPDDADMSEHGSSSDHFIETSARQNDEALLMSHRPQPTNRDKNTGKLVSYNLDYLDVNDLRFENALL